MRISINWLKDYVCIDVNPEELARTLTFLGLEIEAIERPGAEIHGVYVGRILSLDPHPNADKLVVCRTDVGRGEPLQIVCGAKNMKPGDLVPTAVVGASLPGGFEIGQRKMRGIESHGMMCSGRELGLGDDHSGLLILPEDFPLGEDIKPLLGLDDVILDVSVTPNRGDWASFIGVAREVAAYYRVPWTLPKVDLREARKSVNDWTSITIDAPELCPRYCARILTGVKVAPSPDWLARRLLAVGQRPINNIVDITNYVLMETGHPLHAFDYERLEGHRIIVRNSKQGETIETLDGVSRKLTAEMLVIADSAKPVAVAGVMGGSSSEVHSETTTILLESAYFNPVSIRRTARTLGMNTEASSRFQRGADPEMAVYALDRAAALMQQLAGAEVAPGAIDCHPRPATVPEISLRYARTGAILGTHIPGAEQKELLERLSFAVTNEDADSAAFRVPTWRPDVTGEIDLIEEVARLHGYAQIEATLPRVRPSEQVYAPAELKLRQLRNVLVSLGLTEMIHWTFSSQAEVAKTGLGEEYKQMVALENPLSENHATMRTSLAPALISTISNNFRRGVASVAAFEMGAVYRDIPGSLPEQHQRLGVVMGGTAGEKHWSSAETQYDFYDLKGILEAVFESFGAVPTLTASSSGVLQPGQGADIALNGKSIGFLGQLNREVSKTYDLNKPVYVLELDLHPLLDMPLPVAEMVQPPKFPASLRDLAVVVENNVPAADLQAAAAQSGGELLRYVYIFDVYTGKPIPLGHKSIALSLVFQAEDRTLTDADTQSAMDSIVKTLQTAFGATLR